MELTAILLSPLLILLSIDLLTRPSRKKIYTLRVIAAILFIVWSFLFLGINGVRKNHPGATELMISMLTDAISLFAKDIGRCPSNDEGLSVLVDRPNSSNNKNWKGPYLSKSVPKDPWGHPFVYFSTQPNEYKLYSYGADGISKSNGNDPDDINTWDTNKKWTIFYAAEGRKVERIEQINKYIVRVLYPLMILYLIIRSYKKEKI